MTARSFDHIVLPTESLGVARNRLHQLGFTVAPEGVHPFGTHNACVYLSDGTFLEALAIKSPELVASALLENNSFVAGDRRFRERYGNEGVSALVFASHDAKADQIEFEKLGIAGGPLVQFSRPSVDADGKEDIASFLLAFAGTDFAPEHYFFSCEKQNVPNIDRSALEAHANGAVAISSVVTCALQPQGFGDFIALAGRSVCEQSKDDVYRVSLANVDVNISPAKPDAAKMKFHSIIFNVSDISDTMALFDANGINYVKHDDRLCVPAVAGQGADFIFKELP